MQLTYFGQFNSLKIEVRGHPGRWKYSGCFGHVTGRRVTGFGLCLALTSVHTQPHTTASFVGFFCHHHNHSSHRLSGPSTASEFCPAFKFYDNYDKDFDEDESRMELLLMSSIQRREKILPRARWRTPHFILV